MRKRLILLSLCLILAKSAKAGCTLTSPLGLCKQSFGDINWNTALNNNFDILASSVPAYSLANTFTNFNTFTSSIAVRSGAYFGSISSSSSFTSGGTLNMASGANLNLSGGGVITGVGSGLTNVPASQLTGNLQISNFNSGTNADSSHFWRGDGTWAIPPGGTSGGSALGVYNGDGVLVSSPTSALNFSSNTLTVNLEGTTTAQITLNCSSATCAGSTYNGNTQLVETNSSGVIPNTVIDKSSITAQGNSFNGNNQLLKLTASALVPNANIDKSSITAAGNAFNTALNLVQLTSTGKYPAVDGSLITNLNASNINSGQVPAFSLFNAIINQNTLQSGATFFVSSGSVNAFSIPTLGSGLCVHTTAGGQLTTTAGDCASGTTTDIYPATATASFPYGFSASTSVFSTSVASPEYDLTGTNNKLFMSSTAPDVLSLLFRGGTVLGVSTSTGTQLWSPDATDAEIKIFDSNKGGYNPTGAEIQLLGSNVIVGAGDKFGLGNVSVVASYWQAPNVYISTYTLTMPTQLGSAGQFLQQFDSTGTLKMASPFVRGAGIGGSGTTITAGVTTASYTASSGSPYAADASTTTTVLVTVDANLTMNGPTNGVDGQKITFRLKNDASHAVTFATGSGNFAFGSTITSYTVSPSSADYVGAIYYSTTNRWHIVSNSSGFPE